MTDVVLALAPVFPLLAVGWALRATRFLPDDFWPPAEKLTYFVLFPALLVSSTAKADLGGIGALGIGGALAGAVLAVSAATLALRRRIGGSGPSFTSLFQGAIRVNTYVALAAGAALFGQRGTAAMAVAVLAFVPLVNVLSVLVLVRYAEGTRGGLRSAVLGVATNPLILAVLAGALMNAAGLHRVPVVTPMLDVMGAASLPLGLLAVGAGLDLPAARRSGRGLAWACGLKLALQPAVAWLLCLAAGVEGVALAAVVLYAGMPTSSSSYVLARRMGGDAELMAGLVTVQHLLAAATLPAILALLSLSGAV